MTDAIHMARALQLAARGHYSTAPNPRVGCVLVKDGYCAQPASRWTARCWKTRRGR
jgi:pyrimidine deaminase RibD-like protein